MKRVSQVIVGFLVIGSALATILRYGSGSPRSMTFVPQEQGSYGDSDSTRPSSQHMVPASVSMREELVVEGEKVGVLPPRQTVSEQLASLQSVIESLPEYDGTDAGFRKKYLGLGPRDLERIYPVLAEIRKKEMFAALDDAIARGKQEVFVAAAGQPMDFGQWSPPGTTVQAFAHRAEPLGSGAIEYRVVRFGTANYPDVYARILEETWVHDRLDEAGLCGKGEDRH